jgi:hypothetical protein
MGRSQNLCRNVKKSLCTHEGGERWREHLGSNVVGVGIRKECLMNSALREGEKTLRIWLLFAFYLLLVCKEVCKGGGGN